MSVKYAHAFVPHLLRYTVISPAAMSLLAVQGLLALQAEKRGVSSRLFLASTGAPAPSRRSVTSGTRTREAARWRGLQERELNDYTCLLVDTCMKTLNWVHCMRELQKYT